jgi:hypothetical protein
MFYRSRPKRGLLGRRAGQEPERPERVQPFMRTPSIDAINDAANRLQAKIEDAGGTVGDSEYQSDEPQRDAAAPLEAEKDDDRRPVGHDENLHERPGATKEARLHRVHHPSSNAAKGAELLARLKALKQRRLFAQAHADNREDEIEAKALRSPHPLPSSIVPGLSQSGSFMYERADQQLSKVADKLAELLSQEEDPHHAIRDAANRLSAVGLANYTPEPNETPVQFVLNVVEGNPLMFDRLQDMRMEPISLEPLSRFETAEELVTALLPRSESLD